MNASIIIGTLISFGAACLGFWLGRGKVAHFLSHLDKLTELSTDISSSVDQVASVSQEISKASLEQLETLNSTASASHEIRSMVERTTENASQLRQQAGQLRHLIESGNSAVDQMVTSSQDIKNTMGHFQNEMQQSIAELTNALSVIQEIASKTQLINEIVFQTKLLSFNASVEAARAGEAGKGFAVVAQEVGSLAQMSGNAANEISQIVSRSLTVVDGAIRSTKDKIESLSKETAFKSDLGFTNSKACEKTFHDMGEKIEETAQMIEHISAAAHEQAQGVGQLDQSILSFREAADRNRLVASQASEHSHEFRREADQLHELAKECATLMNRNMRANKNFRKFIWTERLDLHVPHMDNEHKTLVARINNLIEALERNNRHSDLPSVRAAYSALAQYTVEHFTHEEKYMEEIDYPQRSSHKKIHKKLLDQVTEFGHALDAGQLDDTKLISFLSNWLISHIMGVDMQYSKHARSRSQRRAA